MDQLNIREAFAIKAPRLAKIIPGFVYRYIEKTVHQAHLNEFIKTNSNKNSIDFAGAAVAASGLEYTIVGYNNLPQNGRCLFISNHPLGGLDGVLLINLLGKQYGNIKAIVNDILMQVENLKPVFIPVNKHGSNSRQYINLMNDAFASDIPILTFPAGMCSRKINGSITDLDWRKNFLEKAIQHKRNIVPIHFDAQNSKFFYNLSNFRKRIGIKANIEMFYLADEMFKQSGKKATITIGKYIDIDKIDKSKNLNQWTAILKKHVYELKRKPDIQF